MRSKKRKTSPERASPDDALLAMDSLRRIVRAIRVYSHTTEENLPISGAQLFVLQCLEHEPGMSLKALAHRTLTDASSVSVVVNRLVATGMIKRRTSDDDARRSHLELTPRGRALLRKAPRAVQSRLIEGLRTLPRSELASVASGLRKLALRLGVGGETPTMFFEGELTQRKLAKGGRRARP
jgi:DNA-binding MarR family transcriptional regulator